MRRAPRARSAPYSEIIKFCQAYPHHTEAVFANLAYIDVVHHGRRSTVPALFSVGLVDEITPASTVYAAYNHYASREDLLYAAAVHGLERITTMSVKLIAGGGTAPALASAYLRPEMRATRRLLAELHLASGRDERLAALLAAWHRTWTKVMIERLPAGDPTPAATVKAIFLLLLGLCHYDDLPAVRAPRAAVAERAELAFGTLAGFTGS